MLRWFSGALFALCATVTWAADRGGEPPKTVLAFNTAIAFRSTPTEIWKAQFDGAPGWSTMGVVADGTTDNTAALNALVTTNPIKGDCPAGSTIRFNGQWALKSNLRLWVQPGCQLVSYWNGAQNSARINQADVETPLTDIQIYGMNIRNSVEGLAGRTMALYVNGFTMAYFTIGTNDGAFSIRGSDQEFAHGTVTNSWRESGGQRVGIRHFGNVPKVPTTASKITGVMKPANVWIHDNPYWESGDGVYQISPGNQGAWADTSADDYIFEDNVGFGWDGALILIGQSDRVGGVYTNTVSNVIFRRMSGAGLRGQISCGNSDGPTSLYTNILFEDINLDASGDNATFAVSCGGNAPMSNLTFRRVTVTNPYATTFGSGDDNTNQISNLVIEHNTIGVSRTALTPSISLRGTLNAIIRSNSITTNGAGIQLGARPEWAPTGTTVQDNAISGVGNNRAGISLENVTGATVTGNNVISGGANAYGILLQDETADEPGAHNNTVTGNNVASLPNVARRVDCAPPAQGNIVNSNTGASDCP